MSATMKNLLIRPADVSLAPLGAGSSVADARVGIVYDRDVWIGGQPVPRVPLVSTSIPAGGLRVPVLASDDPSITEGAGFVIKVIVETTPRIGQHNDTGTSLARTIQVVTADPDEIPLGSKSNLTVVTDPLQYADVMSAIKAAAETKAAAAQVKASADAMVADVVASKDAATQTAADLAATKQLAASMVGPTDAGTAALVQTSSTQTRAALSATFAAKARTGAPAVGQGEIVLSVYDFGATNSEVTSSQAALDACYAEAVARTQGGTVGVTISVPYGSVVGDFKVGYERVSFTGPGVLYGSISYVNRQNDGLGARFYASVDGLSIKPKPGASGTTYGVRVLGGAMVEVKSCTIEGVTFGVLLDHWGSAISGTTTALTAHVQINKTVHVHHSTFVNVDWGLYASQKDGSWWDAHADCKFTHNIVRVGYVGGVYVPGADGFDVESNIFFSIGHKESNPTQKARKGDIVFFGPGTQWASIRNNKIFEAGKSGVRLYRVANAQVTDNQICWGGQLVKSPAIWITVYSGNTPNLGPSPITVSGNLIDENYGDGVLIDGDTTCSAVTISESNQIRLIGSSPRNVYYGQAYGNGAQDVSTIAAIRVATGGGMLNWPRINRGAALTASRRAVLDMRGALVMSWRRDGEAATHTTFQVTKAVTAGQAITLGKMYGPHETALRGDHWAGRVRVLVRNYQTGAPSYSNVPVTATYSFDTEGYTKSVANVTSTGFSTANSGGTYPAFAFSIDSGGNLIATPQGNTAGANFVFDVEASGFVVVSMTASDYAALSTAATLDAPQSA